MNRQLLFREMKEYPSARKVIDSVHIKEWINEEINSDKPNLVESLYNQYTEQSKDSILYLLNIQLPDAPLVGEFHS